MAEPGGEAGTDVEVEKCDEVGAGDEVGTGIAVKAGDEVGVAIGVETGDVNCVFVRVSSRCSSRWFARGVLTIGACSDGSE